MYVSGGYYTSHMTSVLLMIDSKKLRLVFKSSSLELLIYRSWMLPICEGFGRALLDWVREKVVSSTTLNFDLRI